MINYTRDEIRAELRSNGFPIPNQAFGYDADEMVEAWKAGYRKALNDAHRHIEAKLRKVYDDLRA